MQRAVEATPFYTRIFSTKPPTNFEKTLFAILIIVTPFLFLSLDFAMPPSVGRTFFNLGHAPFFAIFSYVLYQRLMLPNGLRWFLVGSAILLIGLTVEYLQTWVYRSASWSDVGWDMLGFACTFFWMQKNHVLIWCARFVLLAVYSLQISTFCYAAYGYYQVLQQFPIIADFEIPQEVERWQGPIEISKEVASNGEYSLKCRMRAQGYSDVSLKTLAPNWQGFDELVLDVYNPSNESFDLSIRVHDRFHIRHRFNFRDRFNQAQQIQPGWNTILVDLEAVKNAPESREMAMDKIQSVILFTKDPGKEVEMYIDKMRLR